MSIAVGVKKDPAGVFTNTDLNGKYYFRRLGIHNFEASDREAEICDGYIDFNGAGSWDGQVTCFDSDQSSDFTFNFDGEIDTGYISPDKSFAILSDGFVDSSGIHLGIVTALKISDSPLSLSDLNGTWRYRDFELRNFENTNVNANTCSVRMVINNGNWNASAECLDSDGDTDTVASVSGTYVINGKAFDLYESGNSEVLVSAYLSKAKNTFIFTRAYFLENEFFKGIAVKEGTKTYTNADLSGTYFMQMLNIWDIESNGRGGRNYSRNFKF